MRNFHPIYHIKTLMIRRELEKDESLRNENWERFLPNFKKANPKKQKKGGGGAVAAAAAAAAGGGCAAAAGGAGAAEGADAPEGGGRPAKKKKAYTPFPPVQPPRKVDLQLESGEFFLSEAEKEARKKAARSKKQRETVALRAKEREQRFEPPKPAEAKPSGSGKQGRESLAQLGERLKARAAASEGGKGGARGGAGGAHGPGGAAAGAVGDYLGGSARKRLRAAEGV